MPPGLEIGSCFSERIYVGSTPLLYFMFGTIQLFSTAVMLSYLEYNRKVAKDGNIRAARILVLSAYTKVVYYVAFVNCFIGLTTMTDFMTDSVIMIGIIWGLYRVASDGVAFLLLRSSIGIRTLRQTVALAVSWSFVSSIATAFAVDISVQSYFIAIAVVSILLSFFYLSLWLVPLKLLPRRPAAINYGRFFFVVTLAYLAAVLMIIAELKYGYCAISVVVLLVCLLQPFVILRALQEDSQYWQGLVTIRDCNLNEPLVGVWDLESDTVETISSYFGDSAHTPIPMIHFGLLSLKSSKFFSGGSARVYKGEYKGEQVAVKILFNLEVTKESVVEFCAEATLLHSLKHANIVSCRGVCVMPPAICLVTEFCSRGSLYHFLYGFQDGVKNYKLRRQQLQPKLIDSIIGRLTGSRLEDVDYADEEKNDNGLNPAILLPSTGLLPNGADKSDKRYHACHIIVIMYRHSKSLDMSNLSKDNKPGWVPDSNINYGPGRADDNAVTDTILGAKMRYSDVGITHDFKTSRPDELNLRQASLASEISSRSNIETTSSDLHISRNSQSPAERDSSGHPATISLMDSLLSSRTSWVDGALLPLDLRMRMIRDCARGVCFLHSRGLVHCDIKSLNFLVAHDLTVKLADLGQARQASQLPNIMPQSGVYSPPEVLYQQSDKFSDRVDVWSLMLVFSEIFMHKLPYEGIVLLDELARRITDEGLRPNLPDDTPEWLRQLVEFGWQTEATSRPDAKAIVSVIEDHTRYLG